MDELHQYEYTQRNLFKPCTILYNSWIVDGWKRRIGTEVRYYSTTHTRSQRRNSSALYRESVERSLKDVYDLITYTISSRSYFIIISYRISCGTINDHIRRR